jgi:serine phosphatase RsbU (regulator of sigma subunit)
MNRATYQAGKPAEPSVKTANASSVLLSVFRQTGRAFKGIGRGCLFTFVWAIRFFLIISALATFAARTTLQSYVPFFLLLILASISFAILRMRLVSFRLFFNRSLVYSLLTISLALVYFTLIALAQIFKLSGNTSSLPGDPNALDTPFTSEAAIVVTTLVIVALFSPLRTRIQKFIDKRFYRRTYDSARVISAFTATLREEIDLDQLNQRLIAVVQETLLPGSVSLWLRAASDDAAKAPLRLVQWQPKLSPHQHNEHTPKKLTVELVSEPVPSEESFTLAISHDDTLLASLLNTTGVIEVDRVPQDSALWQALAEAQVKIALPLISRGELVGLFNLGARLSGQHYTLEDRALLNTLFAQVTPALRVAQMVQEQQGQVRELERIEQEMRTAQLIQLSLLPEALPNLTGWQLDTYYKPAREVGGDFYDFIPFEDGRLGLVIGDATDHGMPAALVMTTTATMLRTAAQASTSPGEVLARVNDLLYPRIPARMFVTCFYAILDPQSGRLHYANAGQNWPFRHYPGGTSELQATGMPLGMMPGSHYEEQEVTLVAGESILFYSDGLVEAHDSQQAMFGLPRLQALLETYAAETTLLEFLMRQLTLFTGNAWEQEDDVTLLTLHRTPLC